MIAQNVFSFFIDPILRAPTIGCMLMCLAASLMGVMVVLRKQSLIGEALSHASYPGVIFGVILAGVFAIDEHNDLYLSLFALLGAFCSSIIGLWVIHFLEKRMRVPSDAALCFVLSTFFGVGLTLTSEVQFSFTALYKKVLNYLYGQAATMTDIHIVIYGSLAAIILIFIILFYKEIQIMIFDRQYAKSLGIQVTVIDTLLLLLITLAVIVGIRSVGVVLMSAMLIAPAVAARQFTNRLSILFVLASIFGMSSGFLGNYLSVQLTEELSQIYPKARIVLPTGPMIVLTASVICLCALLFAPERGFLMKLWRIICFRDGCIKENILKTIWRINPDAAVSVEQIAKYQTVSRLYLKIILYRLKKEGWLKNLKYGQYALTIDGQHRAAKIVRLHRLWEVYLANYLGVGIERVHRNAEEMEHIITPELEQELTLLLQNPTQDPHQQPIPSKERLDAL